MLPSAGALHADLEGHRTVLDGAQGQVQPRPGGQAQVQADGLGGPGHQGLVIDLLQALPSHPRRDAGQMLLAEDQS